MGGVNKLSKGGKMLGKNIMRLRRKLGLTQERLAEEMNVTRSSIARWENGIDLPKMANLIDLAKVFGVSVDELTNTNISGGKSAPSAKQQEYHKFKRTFARGIAFATSLIILGVAGMMFCINGSPTTMTNSQIEAECSRQHSTVLEVAKCVSDRTEDTSMDAETAAGMIVLFAAVILAVPFYIILGIQYSTLKKQTAPEDRAVPEGVQAKINRNFPLQIAVGVCLVLIGALGITVSYGVKIVPEYSTLPVAVLMVLVAIAVFLFISGGVMRSSITEMEEAERLSKMSEKEQQRIDLVGKLCGVIMLLATAIFLCGGFIFDVWSWLWPVFPIGGILCGVLSVILAPPQK
jgi:transcriptional regulator with XRE-family HTH domain